MYSPANTEHKMGTDVDIYRVTKTKAMPKRTLFGTALEVLSPKEKEQAINSESKPVTLPGVEKSQKNLPDYVKKNLKGQETAVQARRVFEERKKATEDTRKGLQSLEQDAILMCTGASKDVKIPANSAGKSGERSNQWLSSKDLEHSREINIGLMPDNRRNFNRDKYGRLPPIYKSPAVDVFSMSKRQEPAYERQNQQSRASDFKEFAKITDAEESSQPPARSCIPLPANIRHRFGSRICDSLLSDEKKVLDTMARQKSLHSTAKDNRDSPNENITESIAKFTKNASSDYNMISNASRQNVFPGYSISNRESSTKSAFSDKVHLQRQPETDEFRYRRDELSKWAEHNVLRQRMKKAWDEIPAKETHSKN